MSCVSQMKKHSSRSVPVAMAVGTSTPLHQTQLAECSDLELAIAGRSEHECPVAGDLDVVHGKQAAGKVAERGHERAGRRGLARVRRRLTPPMRAGWWRRSTGRSQVKLAPDTGGAGLNG